MLKLLQMLLSQRLLGVLLLLLLVLVVYLVGNLVGLEWLTMHLAAASIVVLLLIGTLLRQQVAAKAAGALEQALRAQGQAQVGSVRPDQRGVTEDLKKQFDESLQLLRSSKLGRGALYSIPWYLLIGPPGSGKSTLLRQSGLSFPYMTKGRSAIRGLGGTKNCDWWFADRGILLDTAGRFTTEAEDHGEWLAFLRMLKKGRKHRPVNGAIVAIGMPELIESTEAELLAYSENVRDRIDELTRELQTVFPVYVVFTKTDRLRGFVETFDTLKPDQRKQVWGFTMPYETGQVGKVAEQFGAEFDELYRALCVRRVDLLASDHFKKRRAQLCTFPLQFLRIKERLQSFLGNLQQDNPYQEVSPIRGVYFTSGTQEGTTIDRILKVLRPAELEQDVPEESRRCYFVDDLFNRVVFPDASLAGPTSRSAGKEKWLRIGSMVASAALVLIALVLGWSRYSDISRSFDEVASSLGARPEMATAEQLRSQLDAKLNLFDRSNEQLKRGGVDVALATRYEVELVPYAQALLRGHVDGRVDEFDKVLPDGAWPDAAMTVITELVAKVEAAVQELATLEGQLNALRGGDSARNDDARRLWSLANGGRHFERLTPELRKRLDLESAAARIQAQQKRFRDFLAGAKAADLKTSKELNFDQLFLNAARSRDQQVPCSATSLSQAQWAEAVLELQVPCFLFSMATSTASARLETVLDVLAADVAAANQRAAGSNLLRSLPDSQWEEHVQKRRGEFLSDLRTRFDQGWAKLLNDLREHVSGGTAMRSDVVPNDVARLAVMPQLQRAYGAAVSVLDLGRTLDAASAATAEAAAGQVLSDFNTSSTNWLAKFAVAPSDLKGFEEWAKTMQSAITEQNLRVGRQNLGGKAEVAFDDLERALHDTILRRGQASCRRAIQKLAETSLHPGWNRLKASFPFDADALSEADFPALKAALNSVQVFQATVEEMKRLDSTGYATSQEFDDVTAKTRFLCQLLGGKDEVVDKPSIPMQLRLSMSGKAITRVELTDGDNTVSSDGVGAWKITQSANLQMQIEVDGGDRPSLAIKNLVHARYASVGQRQGKDAGADAGYWNLKRLFMMGKVIRRAKELVCELQIEGQPENKIQVTLTSERPEVVTVFDKDWPAADFITPSPKIWKEEP